MIIGVCGKKGHGKDTISDYLVEKYGFVKYAFADALKRGLKELFDLTDEQLYGEKKEEVDSYWGISPREIMQIVGTDLLRERFNKDFHVLSLKKKILNEKNKNIIISDVRFENEIMFIKDMGGIIIKVIRENMNDNDSHISENIVSKLNFKTIENNETKEKLYNKIDLFIKSLN